MDVLSKNIVLSVVLAGFSCTKSQPQATALKSEVTPQGPDDLQEPGTGYVAVLGEFVSGEHCVTSRTAGANGPAYAPAYNPQGSLHAGFSEDEDTTQNKFGMGASVQGSYGVPRATLNVGGRLDISTALVDHQKKTSAFTIFTHQAGNLVLVNPVLTSRGIAMAAETNPVTRFLNCGDEFVYQVTVGSRLVVGLEFSFATAEIKNDFSLKVEGSAKIGGEKFSRTFLDVDKQYDLETMIGVVRVIFEQEGGDRAAYEAAKRRLPMNCLLTAFADTGDKTKAKLAGYDPCLEAYRHLTNDYAAHEFPKQMLGLEAAASKGVAQAGYVPMRYYTMPYEKAGFPEFRSILRSLPAPLVDFMEHKVKPLIEQLRNLAGNIARVDAIMHSTTADTATLELIVGNLKADLNKNVPQIHQFIQQGNVLRSAVTRALKTCRNDLLVGLGVDLSSATGTAAGIRAAITKCDGYFGPLGDQMKPLL